ncbi:facilitated trehalose transporter Tret1-like [Procambarus clarkii]|uniref:facilitated trehalose transporter Tret1-like n=1 Tax=Procambarus clarkii TaxID=6728 RepID=UPI001E673A7C|nr:facilitated trehalose transporter Tret1-like [Procambarus clarkii]
MKYDLEETSGNSSSSTWQTICYKKEETTYGPSAQTTESTRSVAANSQQTSPEGHSHQNLLHEDSGPAIAPQVFAVLVVAPIQLAVGVIMGFSGITLPQMTDPETHDLFLNSSQAALFGSLVNLGGTIGFVVCGPLLVNLGRRLTLLLTLPFLVASWLALALSDSVWLLLTSRTILGVIMSILDSGTGQYITEIAHKNVRGTLTGATALARQTGSLMAAALGISKLDWRQMGLVYCGLSAIPFFGLLLLPNSPRWLVSQGRVTEARKALNFFRGKHYASEEELKGITQHAGDSGRGDSSLKQARLILEPATLRMFCLVAFLILLMSWNGSYAMTTYLVPIFQSTEISLDPYITAIIFGSFKVLGTFINLCIIDRVGRKPILILSYSVSSLCMAAYGVYLYIKESRNVDNIWWLPLAAVFIYILFIGIGQPVFAVLCNELFSTSCRSITDSLIGLVMMFGMFVGSQTFPMTVEALGEHGTFWIFSGVCATLTIVSAVALSETRGRSLEEITSNQASNPKSDSNTLPL